MRINATRRNPQGKLRFFEVKTSTGARPPSLSDAQEDITEFVTSRLTRAKEMKGAWKNVSPEVSQKAAAILEELESSGRDPKGLIIRIKNLLENPEMRVERW